MSRKANPGDNVILTGLPPGFLDDLPEDDERAISDAIGKPVRLNGYDEDGRAELEFTDSEGITHLLYVSPDFIKTAPADRPLTPDH